jgi:hypothetical protein
MLLLLLLVNIGGAAAVFFGAKCLICLSFFILTAHIFAWIFYSHVELTSFIALFSHLSALQGGYLLGGYYFHNK